MLSDGCPVLSSCPVLCVCNLDCGQTVGWTKMPLGTEIDRVLGRIVLDEDLAPASPRKEAKQPPALLGLQTWPICLLWRNRCMVDQDATWYECKPRCTRHCVRWGPSYPRKGALLVNAVSSIFLLPVSACAIVGRLLHIFCNLSRQILYRVSRGISQKVVTTIFNKNDLTSDLASPRLAAPCARRL